MTPIFRALSLLSLSVVPLMSACRPGMLNSEPEATAPRVPAGVAPENAGLRARTTPLAVGDMVPDFTLRDQLDRVVSSSELTSTGAVVMIFLPAEGSAARRAGFQWALKNRGTLAQRGIEVLLVSPESVERNAQVAAREELRLALLSDPSSVVAQASGYVARGTPAPDRCWLAVFGTDGRVHYSSATFANVSEVMIAAESMPGKKSEWLLGF